MNSFLDEVAARTPAPGGGAVAAMTAASAAALVSMAARFSTDEAVAEAGDELRARLVQLSAEDAAAYTAVLAAPRGEERRKAMQVATDVPRAIASAAAEVALLAHGLVESGNPRLLGDARVAELLAESAGKAAGVLVDINTRQTKSP